MPACGRPGLSFSIMNPARLRAAGLPLSNLKNSLFCKPLRAFNLNNNSFSVNPGVFQSSKTKGLSSTLAWPSTSKTKGLINLFKLSNLFKRAVGFKYFKLFNSDPIKLLKLFKLFNLFQLYKQFKCSEAPD